MLRYAITNLSALAPTASLDESQGRRMRFAKDLHRWTEEGIDFVQLREKELNAGEVFALASEAMQALRTSSASRRPRLLINGRPDLAIASRADGVHLTSRPGELQPAHVREVFRRVRLPFCLISVSCHTLADVARARELGADLILFGPVFEKRAAGLRAVEGTGLAALTVACAVAGPVPVLALGGVDANAAGACLSVGAAGVAAIRLFAEEQSSNMRK